MRSEKGFALIIIIIIATLVIGAGVGGFLILREKKAPPSQKTISQEFEAITRLPVGTLEEDLEIIPWEISSHAAFLASSKDGKTWTSGTLLARYASVPDIIQLRESVGPFPAGALLVYFVNTSQPHGDDNDTPFLIYSLDNGRTWSGRVATNVYGAPEGTIVVDPSLVQLDDGLLRMYYWDIAASSGPPWGKNHTPAIYAAVSRDGVNFKFEGAVYKGQKVWADPEVVEFDGKWYLFLNSPDGDMAVSDDPLRFEAAASSVLNGLPGAMVVDDELRVFVCGIKGIEEFQSKDGHNFVSRGSTGIDGCDQSPVRLQDGKFLMVTKHTQPSSQPLQQQQPQSQPQQIQQQPQQPPQQGISVKFTGAKYKTVSAKPTTGWFKTGQNADIMLSGIDFNNTGGPLLFNHPGAVASDGTHLLLADRNNNRVLIWNKLPTGNTSPDLVLGQLDFTSNTPGTGLNQLNWPVSVSAVNGKVIVADTYNDRILIWNNFPTRNGQAADMVITGDRNNPKRNIGWPWAVWTNGEKFIVASTAGARVLIWNTFPSQNNQEADIVLTANGNFGTPRSIATDGKRLMIGDHNAKPNSGRAGNFFWKTFPTQNDAPYDFFVSEPSRMGEARTPQVGGDVLWGGMTSDGKLFGITNMLYIWNSFPENENDAPDIRVGGVPGQTGYDFGGARAGDGTGGVSGGRFYLSLSNGNKIVGFHSLPTRTDQLPDFAIGAPDIHTNTLQTHYLITNGVPATNGKSLLVSSDFDRKVYIWKYLPDESGAYPDVVLPYGGWDNELHGETFALAGQREVYIWKKLPLAGEKPDLEFKERIGSVNFQEVRGVAFDDKYFYLSDSAADKIYAWEGFPSKESEPKFVLSTNEPRRLYSDGKYLVVSATLDNENGHVRIYEVEGLNANSQPTVIDSPRDPIRTNLPEYAIAGDGHLFIADTGFNRVLVWKNIEDALNKKQADVILGAEDLYEVKPEIGRDKLFWPAGLAFDGSFLWVGEFKFSGRLLRFSVQP